MPDNVGAAPAAEVLPTPNTQYRRPENPMEKLKAKAVIGIHEEASLASGHHPQAARPLVATYNADSPQEATGAPESHDNVQVQPAPQPDIKGSPYARIRVLERERELERRRNNELAEQVTLLAKVVEKAGLAEDDEVEEEEPLDPLSKIARGNEKMLQEFREYKEEREAKDANQQMSQIVGMANSQIQAFSAEADKIKPGMYAEAIAHLANVKMAEILDDDDSISESDAAAKVAEWANNIRIKAVKSGKNPGEEFMRRSVLHGYTLPAAPAKPVAPKPVVPNATEQVQKERARKDGLASISTVQGSPVNDPMRSTAGMSEKDRVKAILQSQKDKGQMRRSAPLMETLAHKIRR